MREVVKKEKASMTCTKKFAWDVPITAPLKVEFAEHEILSSITSSGMWLLYGWWGLTV